MKLFETLQTNWLFLGFSPNLRPFNRQQLKLLFGGAIVVISLGLYPFYKRLSIREYIDSVYMISGAIVIFIASTSNIVQMAEIFRFVDEFEKAIDMRMKFPTSKILYEKSNRLAEKVCDVFFFVVGKLTPVVYVWPKSIYCCFQYFTSDLAFELPIPMWFPFDWTTPIGYLTAVALEMILMFDPFRYLACVSTLAIGSFVHALSMRNDLIDDIHVINLAINGFEVNVEKTNLGLFKQINELVRAHGAFKDLMIDLNSLYETILTFVFGWSIGTICLSMLMIQIEISHDKIDSMLIFQSMFYGFWSVPYVFVSCEVGQRLTDSFEIINDEFSQLDWYLFPTQIRRILPIIMINTQKPIKFAFFGNIDCSREQFKKVTNAAYTYFMVFREYI